MAINKKDLLIKSKIAEDGCGNETVDVAVNEADNDVDNTSCTATFYQALCVEFEATFKVELEDCHITDVTCLGPCPSAE